mgnify:CR=1 FL=1|jgi:hypothetical protein|tara:strand:- start:271 stop:567 length:297 start_codon:yes stop_codon:yes gene_type:complete
MGWEEDLQAMITNTVELAITQKDAYFKEIEASNQLLNIKDPKEYVFGLIMGQVLMGGIAALAQMKMQQGQGNPTPQDQLMVRDMLYKLVPQIRERIFE